MQHTVRTHNLHVVPMHLLQGQELLLLLLVAVPTRPFLAAPTHPLFAAPTRPLLRRELRPQLRGLLLTRRLAAFPPLFLVALEALVHVPQLAAPQPCLPLADPTLSSAAHDSSSRFCQFLGPSAAPTHRIPMDLPSMLASRLLERHSLQVRP